MKHIEETRISEDNQNGLKTSFKTFQKYQLSPITELTLVMLTAAVSLSGVIFMGTVTVSIVNHLNQDVCYEINR